MTFLLKIVKCSHRWYCLTGGDSFPKTLKSFRILEEIKANHSCTLGKFLKIIFTKKKIEWPSGNEHFLGTRNFSISLSGTLGVFSLSLSSLSLWQLSHLHGMKYICDVIHQIWDFLLPKSLDKSILGGPPKSFSQDSEVRKKQVL